MVVINVSLDIETLSTDSNAVILELALVRFSKTDATKLVLYPSLDEQEQNGGKMDQDTIDWWNKTNSAYLSKLLSIERTSIADCHKKVKEFLNQPYDLLWANSPAFDCVILDNMFKSAKLSNVTDYRRNMCLRTFQVVKGLKMSRLTTGAHSALNDALHQADFIRRNM